MRRLIPSVILAIIVATAGPAVAQGVSADADPRVQQLVASVSADRLGDLLQKLVSFGTRSTLSDASSSTRGVGAARQWILEELRRSSAKLQVALECFQLLPQARITRDVEICNVLATLKGRSERRIYVTAHYDSLNIPGQTRTVVRPPSPRPGFDAMAQPGQDYEVEAPGADDNGSGTVLTMELAQRFAESGIEFDATLVFVLWAGEEQGLVGSRAHVQRMAGTNTVVEAVFNSDIVGGSRGGGGVSDSGSVRVYSEGPEDSMSRALARYVRQMAALYIPSHRIRLLARTDRFSRGSDHQAFLQAGYPAIVFRESNENLDRQHTAADTLDGVDLEYLARNTRVNAAAIAALALAPPAPVVTSASGQPLIGREPSGYDAHLRWTASPGAVAYRIYWRDTWQNDWQHQQLVGNVSSFAVPKVSIDDVVFGVAAVGADGHESLIRAYVSPGRRDPEVKMKQP